MQHQPSLLLSIPDTWGLRFSKAIWVPTSWQKDARSSVAISPRQYKLTGAAPKKMQHIRSHSRSTSALPLRSFKVHWKHHAANTLGSHIAAKNRVCVEAVSVAGITGLQYCLLRRQFRVYKIRTDAIYPGALLIDPISLLRRRKLKNGKVNRAF